MCLFQITPATQRATLKSGELSNEGSDYIDALFESGESLEAADIQEMFDIPSSEKFQISHLSQQSLMASAQP